jgi:methylenetetrahydrofolate dehydrogenase (NADP+) / methenyltetrahydrofolate cyclohydrolase
MSLLDGKAVAEAIRAEAARDARALADRGQRPGLAVVLVGDDAASAVYVRGKARACEEVGIAHETVHLSGSASTEDVAGVVAGLNERADVHGILVQMPLPAQVDARRILDLVAPVKDVDGLHPENVGLLVQKRPRFVPCTPAGIMQLLVRSGIELKGCRAVVVGRSDLVGKPLASLLMHADATVTVCHSRTRDLPAVTREADVLVAAIGRPAFLRGEHVKRGAIVIDVGINRIEDATLAQEVLSAERLRVFEAKGHALVGDVHFPSVSGLAGALTPVPGGVGPLTIAMLMKNTVFAARQSMR